MNKVKQARKRAGMKANELAERAGLTPSHISKVERGLGGVSAGAAKRIAEVLGIPVVDVIFPEEKEAA